MLCGERVCVLLLGQQTLSAQWRTLSFFCLHLFKLTKLFNHDNVFSHENIFRGEKMSTNERYGTVVWEAITKLDQECQMSGSSYWHTVKDVAKQGRVSVPTARKYLRILVTHGHVATIGNNKTAFYALVKEI